MSYYYISHHGIKGQKWGVRRYQNKDGTLTASGKKRYSDGSEKKSDHRLKLEAQYRSQGMSKKEAEKQADTRIQTEKKIALAAGITVGAAAAAVAAKKYYDYAADIVIGTEKDPMYRVQVFDGINNKPGSIYAVYDKKDNPTYAGIWASQLKQYGGGDNVRNMSLIYNHGKGIKLASTKNSRKEFKRLIKNNPEFKQDVENLIKQNGVNAGSNDLYDNFINNMAGDGRRSKAANTFFDALKQKGYGAIRDTNDNKYSGFEAKSAVIAFNGVYDWSAHKLSDREIADYAAQATNRIQKIRTNRALSQIAKTNAIQLGMIAIPTLAVSKAVSSTKQSRARSLKSAGVSTKDIAKQLGISESEVYKLTSYS